jgi:succinyl-CoA synthetase alpha subunit
MNSSGVEITGNPVLSDLQGLDGLETIAGFGTTGQVLVVKDNASLVRLDSLESLTTVGRGGLDISGNPILNDISALANLESVETVVIVGNPSLAACAVSELFARVGGSFCVCISNDPDGTCP